MADAPGPAGRRRGSRPEKQSSEEWRLWRAFGLGLAFIIFALVVIATSL